MKVDGDNMLYAGYGEEISQQASCNRTSMRFFLRLAGIWEVS